MTKPSEVLTKYDWRKTNSHDMRSSSVHFFWARPRILSGWALVIDSNALDDRILLIYLLKLLGPCIRSLTPICTRVCRRVMGSLITANVIMNQTSKVVMTSPGMIPWIGTITSMGQRKLANPPNHSIYSCRSMYSQERLIYRSYGAAEPFTNSPPKK